MKISCIIPTCDRPKFLIEAINSVLAQTKEPEEIIIVNNGANKVVLPSELSPKIIVINEKQYIGAAAARNSGVKVTQGDYLAFLDDDDLWGREYLEKVEEALKGGSECIISRLDKIEDGIISKHKNAYQKLSLNKLFVSNPGVTGSNIVIKKSVFLELGGFDEKLLTSEDKSLVVEAIIKKIKIKVLPDNQTIFRSDRKRDGLGDNPNKMAEGIYRFTLKYKNLMTRRERFSNWLKIYKYRFRAGKKIALIPFLFLYLFKKLKLI
ncbi:MAG: glycosyltransferase family 2 protein [Patescibacteria group bacterium]